MITIEDNSLVIGAPEVHEDAKSRIEFQRTLRIPDDNREYPLPPGLGAFPLSHVDDHRDKIPGSWVNHGGVFLPMHQAEALWISFDQWGSGWPFAIKIGTGKLSAITGEPWRNELVGEDRSADQDYVVTPGQPWLDGYCVQKGLIRQFVAMPLGEGYTAEEQLTGKAEHGGIQIIAYPMKRERCLEWRKRYAASVNEVCFGMDDGAYGAAESVESAELGLAPGGLMRQQIYHDEFGIDAWETDHPSRCFVHILNSAQYATVTGKSPPTQPPTAKSYTSAGLPWFDYYSETLAAIPGSKKLAEMDSVASKGIKQGELPLPENEPVEPKNIVAINKNGAKPVREGEF